MVKTLLFEKNTKYFMIIIDGKKISYTDAVQGKIWGGPLQYLPRDPQIVRRIVESRNRIPKYMIAFFDMSPEEEAEFNNAKDEDELKALVLRDCKANGCKLMEEKEGQEK